MGTSQRTKFALSAISPSKPDSTAIVTSEEFMRYLPQEAWLFLLNTLNVISVVTRARKKLFLISHVRQKHGSKAEKGGSEANIEGEAKGEENIEEEMEENYDGEGEENSDGEGEENGDREGEENGDGEENIEMEIVENIGVDL